MLPPLLNTLGFRCNNTAYRSVMDAINPHGTFRLDMDKRLDLRSAIAAPRPRTPTHQAA